MKTKLTHSDEAEIKQLLVGKTVKKVSDSELLLSDGTTLELVGNEGGCSCGAGDYYLEYLNDCPDNVITNVYVRDFYEDGAGPGRYGEYGKQIYAIFVYATDQKLKTLAEFHGDDGNGYYGTGFHINVKSPQVNEGLEYYFQKWTLVPESNV